MTDIGFMLTSAACGFFIASIVWFFIYTRAQQKISHLEQEISALQMAQELEAKHFGEKLALLQKTEEGFKDQIKALSADILKNNSEQFLNLAAQSFKTLQQGAVGEFEKKHQALTDVLKPVQESLLKMGEHLTEVEKTRVGAYEGLKQQVLSMLETQKELRQETGQLVKALRTPSARGRWGEIQLRRVVEMAGMLSHCDFTEQVSGQHEEGRLRPDVIIHLPAGKTIVVDAKTPLIAYLESLEVSTEKDRKEALDRHAKHIREHMRSLGSKAYWGQFEESPEFVVMFLPGENFFSAALEVDPELIEIGMQNGVILSTPTTLIALLRAVSYGWRQESLAENARQISDVGQELHKRLSDMKGHLDQLGLQLSRSVESYNKTIGTFESRVLVSARKFEDMKVIAADNKIERPEEIEKQPRKLVGS